MDNVKFELNRAGVRELMKSDAMMSICISKAQAMQNVLGPGYTITTNPGKNRVNAEIATNTPEARAENLKSNTILKALGCVK